MLWVLITLQWYFCPWENHEDICVKECSLMLIIREFILMVFLGGLKNCTKTEILDQRREQNNLRKDIIAKLSLVSKIFKAKTHNLHFISMLELYSQTHDMDSALGMKCCIFIFNLVWIKILLNNYLLSYCCLFHPFLTSKNIG